MGDVASGCTSRWQFGDSMIFLSRPGLARSAQPRETTVRMQSGPTENEGSRAEVVVAIVAIVVEQVATAAVVE